MSSILTDSIARDHLADIHAAAAQSRRVKEARRARRDHRGSGHHTDHGGERGHSAATVGHAVVLPFTAVHHWLAAGQL